MSENSPDGTSAGVVHTLRWSELCPWLLLFRAARAALLFRVIVLAWVGVVATQWGWEAIDWATGVDEASPLPRLIAEAPVPGKPLSELQFNLSPSFPNQALSWADFANQLQQTHNVGPLVRGWAWLSQAALQPWISQGPRFFWRGFFAGVWAVVVWSLLGGAIARMAAHYLTRAEKIGPLAAILAARKHWLATAGAPIVAYVGIFLLLLPLILGGLLMRQSVIALAGGALWLVALLVGTALFVLVLGALVGWPLMWAGAAVERSDAFDAVSRCYAYVLQRPFHLLGMAVVASLLGVVCQSAVTFVADGVVGVTEGAVAMGLGAKESTLLLTANQADFATDPGNLDRFAGRLIGGWRSVVMGLAQAFPLAYLWTAATGIYLLLRQSVDSTELDQMSLDKIDPTSLPPLTTDPETELPQVAKNATTAEPADATGSADDPPATDHSLGDS